MSVTVSLPVDFDTMDRLIKLATGLNKPVLEVAREVFERGLKSVEDKHERS
jgi:hypothetical protein